MSDARHAAATERALIVNGDDFGRTPGINRGVVRAHEHGVLTSASLMVRWPAAAEAAAYCRNRPALSLGLHLDLGEWRYRGGRWQTLYRVASTDDAEAVAAEVAGQLAAFRRLVGREPTHVDSHQHVHLCEPVRSVLMDAVRPLGIPSGRTASMRTDRTGSQRWTCWCESTWVGSRPTRRRKAASWPATSAATASASSVDATL